MKKELTSKNKRKWVVGGVVFFSAVALLTTGFATWIIGVTALSQEGSVGVTVDTAKNESVYLTATLSDSSIALNETTNTAGTGNVVTVNDADQNALKISFSELKITYGKDYTFDFTKLHFSFDETSSSLVTVAPEGNLLTTNRTGTSWTYIDCPADLDITKPNQAETDGTYLITPSTKEFEFKWGSFFDNKSPATFYNEKIKGTDSYNGSINKELDDMSSKLNSKTLKVTISLIK